MRRVRRIVKRVMLVLGVFLILLAVIGFIGFRWGLTPLPRPPQGVRIEPLSPPLTAESLTPDNGAFHYMKAVAFIQDHPSSKESKDQIDAFATGDISGNTNAIEQTLGEIRPALDYVREGARAPSCQMPGLDLDKDISSLGSLRQLARWLVADGKWAEHHGDFARAIDDYFVVVKFGTDCAKGGPVIFALVGDAIVGLGTQAIRAYVLQNTNPSNGTQNIVEKLNRINGERMPFAETLRYELERSKGWMDRTVFGQTNSWLGPATSKRVMFANYDAAFGELIEDADKPFWESNAKVIARKWAIRDMSSWFVVFNRPIPRVLVAMILPAMEPVRNKAVRVDLEFEATEVVCALKSYEFRHGAPPDQLTDLVPAFLPAVPTDPFDSKPLRYRREGNEWVLWSVGSDLKDDNAAWHEFKYRKPGEERAGGDIYFKSTEPQDDLAFYLSQQKLKASGPTPSQRTPTASP